MTKHCKGCGEDLTNMDAALSRYRHGDICSNCGILEAFSGDFIGKYGKTSILDYPSQLLAQKESSN